MDSKRIFNILAVLTALGGAVTPLYPQTFTFELMGGSAYNFPTPLRVRQNGYPDINLVADYDTKPFGPYTPYYAIRIGFWDAEGAWEIEHVHQRLFLTNPPPEIQLFAIHYGYNFFMVGRAFKTGEYLLHLDGGFILTSPDNTVRGQTLYAGGTGLLDSGYFFSGFGAQIALSRNFPVTPNLFLSLETALICGWAWGVPVVNGSADVPNIALHGHVGLGLGL